MIVLGVDVGGSSIKAALVDTNVGELVGPAVSVPTPEPSTAEGIVQAILGLTRQFGASGPVGVAFPTVIKQGTIYTAANIDRRNIGVNIEQLTRQVLGRPVLYLNDADAAGIAEMRFGAGVGHRGTVVVLTFGTGIGSALFHEGQLVPNTEFGHLQVDGREAEHIASGRVRAEENLDWPAWTDRVNRVLREYHSLLWPDLFILCGGITEQYAAFSHLLDSAALILPAKFRAQAGIVGAGLAAASRG
jgi:polyphosphate glucokinase